MTNASVCDLNLLELLCRFITRSESISEFILGLFSNKTMKFAMIFSIVMVLALIYVPFLQVIFDTVPLAVIDWLWIISFALMASVATEFTKIYLLAPAKKIETDLTAQMELA